MSLVMLIAGNADVEPVVLASDDTVHIIRSGDSAHLAVVLSLYPDDAHTEFGRITLKSSGARLEAIDGALRIQPRQAQAHSASSPDFDPRTEGYELRPGTDGRAEVFVLRHGDVITSSEITGSLTCTWNASNIQVDSSAAAVEAPNPKTDVAETPEGDETEDELELSEKAQIVIPVTQPKSQPTATPRLSHQLSIVQETPTAVRTLDTSDFHKKEKESDTPSKTPPPEAVDTGMGFSTAPTGHSQHNTMTPNATEADDSPGSAPKSKNKALPEVIISPTASKKRSKHGADVNGLETDAEQSGTNKRARKSTSKDENIIDDSFRGDTTIDLSNKPRLSRGKKRLSEVAEAPPIRTTWHSSQQSTPPMTGEIYNGSSPCVAFSNSAIEVKTSTTIKFLKRNKGTTVESVGEKCNVLCTRDGTLVKTTKIVQAIAHGIPIVTDKWLQDSAGAGRFLDISAYKPSFPEQEHEWNFDFAKIWNKPQTIFEGYTIYLTPGWKRASRNQYESVCKAAGAKITNTKKPKKGTENIVIAQEEDDSDAEKLMQDGIVCYTKDLLTTSILRGKVDLESEEFRIKAGASSVETKVWTRSRWTRKST